MSNSNSNSNVNFLLPFDLIQTSIKQSSKSRKRSPVLLEKPLGSLRYSLILRFLRVFPRSCEPLRKEFPALMKHVSLAVKEHKLNFQQSFLFIILKQSPLLLT